MIDLMIHWSEWVRPSAGFPAVQWALLLALATVAGHLLQRLLGLPKILGYAAVGVVAGISGYIHIEWPLDGSARFIVELALSLLLFEAGGRLNLRWFRHNPLLLVQSLCEAALTYAVCLWLMRLMDVPPALAVPLAMLLTASSPAVILRVVGDLRASGPVTDRVATLATLNTFYVLSLGSVMARLLHGAGVALGEAVYPAVLLLIVSLLVAGVLALSLRLALRLMNPTSESAAVLQIALIAAGSALASHFGGSAPLAALLSGVLLKLRNPRPWYWPRQFGTASAILSTMMFVLVSMAATQFPWHAAGWSLICLLILVRLLAKLVAIGLTGIGSGASVRQSFWTAAALSPLSAVGLLVISQFVQYTPAIATPLSQIALPLILIVESVGTLTTVLALQRAREVSRKPVRCQLRATGGGTHAA